MTIKTVGFIGAGNMSRSIISGMVANGYPSDNIWASNPSQPKLDALSQAFGIHTTNSNLELAQQVDVLVLSVKPQLMREVCEALQSVDLSKTLVLTIAAGVLSERYSTYLAQPISLIRIMPNTPSLLSKGLSGLFACDGVTEQHKTLCEQLMQNVGQTLWVDSEDALNHVIACAGSSPAYFFTFVDAMLQSAIKMGVDESQAKAMIYQSLEGASAMLKHNEALSPKTLAAQVTSKGGTTAAALGVFEQQALSDTVDSAMVACVTRANEMAKLF